jgi:hypothetical protein
MVSATTESSFGKILPASDAATILRLRLLIARAANKDSLHWWDDDSLSEAAGFILGRTFPTAPTLAARSLALRAAFARHQAVGGSHGRALHLYRLDPDNADRLVLEFWPLLDIPVRLEPIPTTAVLRQELLAITGQPMPYEVIAATANGGLHITMPKPLPEATLLRRAQTLAWAYLEGGQGQPCIPYILE